MDRWSADISAAERVSVDLVTQNVEAGFTSKSATLDGRFIIRALASPAHSDKGVDGQLVEGGGGGDTCRNGGEISLLFCPRAVPLSLPLSLTKSLP